jgi:phosphoglycerate dehydrogenase-like enzyme
MPQHWPAGLAGRAVIEVAGQGQLEARLADGGPPVDVVVPLWSPLPGRAIRAGSFGLIQQFGVGVDNIDLDAAADEGVWVANMAGLNAVPVAEHAVALLLALARRLPEAQKGFEPGRWGEPAGRSLAGTAACVVVPGPSAPRSPAGWLPSALPSPAYAAIPWTAPSRPSPPSTPTEPYPADGPLVTHPRIVATAHTASLTSDYFAAASRRLGDALARYLDHQPPSGLLLHRG